jgi:Uma2 family endonuclease
MGNMRSQEALALRWAELCADPRWDPFAGKIELNGLGVIEGSVLTTDGVRAPDVAWASAAFMAHHGDVMPFPQAPEICVEVRSPSNTDAEMEHKTRLFLQAGAAEVWIVGEDGDWQVFDAQGQQPTTRFGVKLKKA